jgi:Domain of unknown function (DUF4145)
MSTDSDKIIKGHCPDCRGTRNAFVRGKHVVHWSDPDPDTPVSSSDTRMILECCGCSRVYFRRDFWFSEWNSIGQNKYTGELEMENNVETTYYPAETRRDPPNWVIDVKAADNTLGLLLDELYSSLNNGLHVLAAIGMRTAFDRASELLGVSPSLRFNKKLDELVTIGKIGKDERTTLDVLIDPGSAAAHRGWSPKAKELETMMQIVEAFLHRAFVLGDGIKHLKAAVPSKGAGP